MVKLSLKSITACSYRLAALIALIVAWIAPSAQGAVIVYAREVGSDVVFSTPDGGSFNLAAWSDLTDVDLYSRIVPISGTILVGTTPSIDLQRYHTAENLVFPATFGTGLMTNANSGTPPGVVFGFTEFAGELVLPEGYASGDPLSGSATYNGATIDSLGMTPGAYTWSWGSGDTADSFTLVIADGIDIGPGDGLWSPGILGSPAIPSAGLDATLDNGFMFLGNLTGRLQRVRDQQKLASLQQAQEPQQWAAHDPSGSLAASQLAAMAGPYWPGSSGGPGVWARGLGWWGERDAESGVEGYDYTLAGLVVGGDYAFGESGFTAGGAFSWTTGDAEVDGSAAEIDSDNYLFGAYLGYDAERFFVDVAVGGGFSNHDSKRSVGVIGLPSTAKADYDGGVVVTRIAGGTDFTLGDGFVLRPLLGLDFVWATRDSYTESGAAWANLSVDSESSSALKLAGMLVATRAWSFDLGGNKATLVPELRVGAVGQFALDNRKVGAAVPGFGSVVFLGNDSDEGRGAVGAGATLWLENGLAVFLDYSGEFGPDTRNSTLNGGLRFVF